MTDYIDAITNYSIVIDNGSGEIKAGAAGEQTPKCIFPNYVGATKHVRVMTAAVEGDSFIGKSAQERRGLMTLKYPMEHGIVTNWEAMEKIWRYIYASGPDQLGVPPEEHPVLLTEAALNPRKNREKAAEIFFENFGVKALYISIQPVLALYATGRITGVVLDSGDGVTQAVPVVEGFVMKHAIMRTDVAGRDVTRHLQQLLRKEGYLFRTSAEFDIVRNIKEEACYVAQDLKKEETNDLDRNNNEKGNYVLPDGNVIKLGSARFRAPEVLFTPLDIGEESEGIHEVLVYAIQKADLDLRRQLFSNVVLSGGSTLFKDLGSRLLSEARKLAPNGMKIKISAPPERKYSTWLGGSILASLESFKSMWTSRQSYEEDGVRALHRKTFI